MFFLCLNLSGQSYQSIQVSGFNIDLIAEGSGIPDRAAATTGTTFDLSGAGKEHVFYSKDFRGNANESIAPPLGLDPGRNYASSATPSIVYQLAEYAGNNALFLTSGTGKLTLSTPAIFEKLSFLATSITTQNITVKVSFTDRTFTNYPSISFPDWLTETGYAVKGVGLVNRNADGAILADAFSGDANKPNFFDCIVTLSATDKLKLIKDVEFSGMTSSMAVFAVCGVTPAGSLAAPVAKNATLATSTGFTANWDIVAGATKLQD
ncbi:MAG: hypothetical protein HC905_01295 [Bacteroidales bacterium]|nr:hypothetical protein [Bacteroidales bacterium]